MNDLIRREDAIRAIEFGISHIVSFDSNGQRTNYFESENAELAKAIERIKEIPSANQWIKCSDRLPPLGEEVLVWAYDRCYMLTLYAYPNKEGYYWNVEDYDIVDEAFDKVIAWMPMPQYESEENND